MALALGLHLSERSIFYSLDMLYEIVITMLVTACDRDEMSCVSVALVETDEVSKITYLMQAYVSNQCGQPPGSPRGIDTLRDIYQS